MKKKLKFTMAFFITMIALELLARIFSSDSTINPITVFKTDGQYFARFNNSFIRNGYGKNAPNFRNSFLRLNNKSSRIVIIGDSFAYGTFLPSNLTFPYLLEQKIARVIKGRKTQVANLSIPGASPQQMLFLIKQAEKLKPSIIIISPGADIYSYNKPKKTKNPIGIIRIIESLFIERTSSVSRVDAIEGNYRDIKASKKHVSNYLLQLKKTLSYLRKKNISHFAVLPPLFDRRAPAGKGIKSIRALLSKHKIKTVALSIVNKKKFITLKTPLPQIHEKIASDIIKRLFGKKNAAKANLNTKKYPLSTTTLINNIAFLHTIKKTINPLRSLIAAIKPKNIRSITIQRPNKLITLESAILKTAAKTALSQMPQDIEKSAKTLIHGLKIIPDNFRAANNLALLYIKKHQHKKGLKLLLDLYKLKFKERIFLSNLYLALKITQQHTALAQIKPLLDQRNISTKTATNFRFYPE